MRIRSKLKACETEYKGLRREIRRSLSRAARALASDRRDFLVDEIASLHVDLITLARC
jgi:hypothetical protein